MVFMNGDNNLVEAGFDDLNEMEQVGSSDDVNVIVQLDSTRAYSSRPYVFDGARRLKVVRDDQPR